MKDGRSATLEAFDNNPVTALIDANNTKLTGICFALVMEHEGQLSIHYRSNQPCYGECRKYYQSHKDTYSDPYPHDEYRPGDLFDPFPLGKPVAVSFGWNGRSGFTEKNIRPYLDRLFGVNSPWISGFGSPEDIEFTKLNDTVTGVILKNTHVNPTVMINLIQNCKKLNGITSLQIDEFGDDLNLFYLSFAGFNLGKVYGSKNLQITNAFMQSYYNPLAIDLPRFLGQNPHDLSGGFFDEGFDYNRKILHETFERSRTVFKDGQWNQQSRVSIPNLVSIYMSKNPASNKGSYDRNLLVDTVAELRATQDKEDQSEISDSLSIQP